MKKKNNNNNANKNIAIIAAIVILLGAGIFIPRLFGGGNGGDPAVSGEAIEGDVIIQKSDITDTVKFYPVKVGNRNMEILAVKAGDGTIRTAFNTCQVCNGSPKAYYKQDGDILVCQNCGNQFSMDMVEQQRGGCNPVPIYKEDKTDEGDNIVISREFIEQNKDLFTANWKTK